MSVVPEIKILTVAAIGLVASLAGNALQGYAYLQQRDAAATARAGWLHESDAASGARASADQCSQSVQSLSDTAAAMVRLMETDRLKAQALAGKHAAAADKILSTPPAVPGNDCASAQARVADLLSSRQKAGD